MRLWHPGAFRHPRGLVQEGASAQHRLCSAAGHMELLRFGAFIEQRVVGGTWYSL